MTFVRTARRGTVASSLSRPPANAMDAAGLDELSDEIERLGADPDVGGIVITGDGGVFSAGLDLKAIGALDAAGQEALIEALNRAFGRLCMSPFGRRCNQWARHRRRARAGSVL